MSGDHNHHLPPGEFRTPEDKQAARVGRCDVCRAHDHTDVRSFALDRDLQPVPAFWFNCPRCGTAESQVHAHRWTEAGMAWMRDNGDFVGTWHQERFAHEATTKEAA